MCQFTAPAFRLNSSHIPTPSPSTARLGSHPPSAGRPSSRHNLRKKKNFPVPVLRDWNGKLCGISDTGACPLSDIRRTTCGGRCPEHSSVWIASSFEMGARSGTRRSVCTAHCSHQISDVRDCLADSASFARCRRRSTGRFDHHLAAGGANRVPSRSARADAQDLCRCRRRSVSPAARPVGCCRADHGLPSPRPPPMDTASGRETLEIVSAAISRLSPNQATAIVMRFIQGEPEAAIAAALGCGIETVREHLDRGRERLGRMLGRLAQSRTSPPSSIAQHLQ